MNKLHDYKIAIPTIAAGLDKRNWSMIKQLIYNEFQNCDIELLICHKTKNHITNSWKTKEHEKVINLIHDHYHYNKIIKNLNNINDNFKKKTKLCSGNFNINKNINNDTDDTNKLELIYNNNSNKNVNDNNEINSIFNNYKHGENVPGDGNCGLYALCNALNDNKQDKITSICQLLELLQLSDLPGHWWFDNELASIANYYNHDTYIFDETSKTAVIHRNKNYKRPPIVLFNTNKNTHWIPGTKSINPSLKIPHNYIEINDFTPLQQIITEIKDKYQNIKKPIVNNELKENIHVTNVDHIITNNSDKEVIYDNEGTPIKISHELNPLQYGQVLSLLKKYIHLFTSDASNIKPANVKPCEIKMKQNYKDPKFHAPHRVSPQQREELKIQLDKLNKANIIRPIISKFAAPAFLVKKKEKGSYRLVVSYKELNERVETDQYPLPRTNDLLRALEGAKYFSSFDLNSGFFQLPIKETDQYKLAFTSVHGLMTFTRLPQGFKNSSAIFQRVLNEAFSALLYKSIIIYIDDLASYGSNFDEALINLNEALKIIDSMNFSLKTSKCHFFSKKIELLGHVISQEGIKPLNTNIKAITEFKQPKTQKDVRSFLGMCSYYRKHIKDFAKIAHPLTELTKGDNKINWLEIHEKSYNTLKKHLTSQPLLKHFDDSKKVFLTTDASLTGLGAYLEQPDDNNILHPIGYASRKLLNSEKTYSSTTLELLGLCFGITYFREYLWGRHFIVFCDNISLQYYENLKTPSARIAQLTLKLLDFNFNILYKKGKENKVADALSRNPINKIDIKNDNDNLTIDLTDIKNQQSNDQFCSQIIQAINNNQVDQIPISIQRKSRQFIILNDILHYKHYKSPNNVTYPLVIPQSLTEKILKSYHESPIGGHTGITRTLNKIQNKYYWPNMTKDTNQYIKSCHNCQINKKINGKPIGQLQPIPLSNRPLDRLTFDYLGPLISSNNKKYVLVAACNNTKFIFTKAVESATAQSTINFIIQIISQWGCFRQFSSDRGTHFKNQMVSEVCENLGIKQILSTSYSPQTQGFVEKINDVLCNSIKNYIDENNQSRWSYYLPYVTLSYNATPQTSTKHSPFYLMHGFEPYFPIDNKIIPTNIPYDIKKSLTELNRLRDKIPTLIKTAQDSQKKYHDQKHRLLTFKPGDSILIKFPFNTLGKSPKLASKYKGPFKIIEKINDLNYKVQLTLNNKITDDIIHVRRMKPYIHR